MDFAQSETTHSRDTMPLPISCIVLMPFGKTAEEKLISRLVYENVFVPAFKDLPIEPNRVDMQQLLDSPINMEMEQQLGNVPLALVDLTGNNANVYYELGFRRARGKPFLCVARGDDHAFYGAQFHVIDYTSPSATATIRAALEHHLTSLQDDKAEYEHLDALMEDLRAKRFRNPFQARIAEWRVRRTLDNVSHIASRDWPLDALNASKYSVYIFGNIVRLLRPEEEYRTVSNIHFWQNLDTDRDAFLLQNIHAALHGAIIKRVILMSKRDLDEPRKGQAKLVLQKHLAALRDVSNGGGQMTVRVKLVDELSDALQIYGHFAVARILSLTPGSDGGGVVIVPTYGNFKDSDSISTVRLLFSKGSVQQDPDTHQYLAKFEAADSGATDLAAFLEEWFPS